MAAILTTKELRSMQINDLQRECMDHRHNVAKMKMGIEMGKEKDTAKYQRAKRLLARMETIMTEKRKSSLPKTSKTTTVSAPRK